MACFRPRKQINPEQDMRSAEIDKILLQEKKQQIQEVKLLLLGPGESGKSTIFKQMRLLQAKGGAFSQEELTAQRVIIYGNCLTQMKVIVSAAEKLTYTFDSPENQERAERLSKLFTAGDSWTIEVGQDIKALWQDQAIKKAYEHRDKDYQLNDSAAYFFDNIDRILESNYIPNAQDALRARIRTTGVDEAVYDFEQVNFRVIDVGGQRSERRKWIHYFDNVTAVLFVAALSEYDQTLREDATQNRMKESMHLFKDICSNPFFENTPFILFLNKSDIFREKIARVPLTICFSTYEGQQEFEEAANYIRTRFLKISRPEQHPVYTHFTCAVNTDNMRIVLASVKDMMIRDVLKGII
eukprot:TRINITY_DN219_c1_g3_i3.p1 TRINITY_DN219_c1_g3~~TRINITY_DN219_c1_g3_i3.p1  ORF type:complete len:355 (-),score=162.00 TRINITY_DN219_c1_g3_i3:251-1315(-)